jgi:hypothetical protein
MPERRLKVFLSHSKQDKWLATQIARRINDCGASTFLDETDIPSGANFKEIINHEISECQEIVALFTPWSAQRFWVWVEVGAAWGQGKRIVAVLYGLSVTKLERIGGSRTVKEDINILDLNEFDRYLDELGKRATEAEDE